MLEALLDAATSRANDTVQPSSSNEQNIPVISYTTHDQTKPRNHWDDPSFFPAAFPTLFPTGFGGHLDKHNVSVSLAAFADSKLQQAAFMRVVLPKPSWPWRLTSMLPADIRRFARHRTFMYLLYDTLLLRSSSLGNS